MASLVDGMFLTLDGVMQGPGGPDEDRGGGFAHGGGSRSGEFEVDERGGVESLWTEAEGR